MKCPKCGREIKEGQAFCIKCGQPLSNNMKSSAPKPQAPVMPQQPQAPQRPIKAQTPVMPSKPNAPVMPHKPAAPQRPQAPGKPHAPEDKGFMANVGRAIGNAVSFGALNREIEAQQRQAVNEQAREAQTAINEAQRAQQTAEQAQIAAERDAERARDLLAMEAVEGVDVVRGRAIWNIQPGEVARRISERELEQIEKLKRIIVQEGCSAIIFANGELVATLSSGAYLFYKSIEEEKAAINAAIEQAEREMDEQERRTRETQRRSNPTFRELGIVGEIGRAVSWVGRIIFGEKKDEQKEKRQRRQIDYARILSRLTQAPVLSVYIVSNRYITMTFGGEINVEGLMEFKPYTIPAGIHNIEVGVSLQMQVSDIHALATNYLADNNSLSTVRLHRMINGTIETILRQALRNVDYQQTGLPTDLINSLKAQIIMAINAQLYGIECTQVLNITDNNQDFERFRSVERELYNTERELDFMHRTGEFRNRMENEENAQKIQSARNEEELRHALQQINKDQIIHDDELDSFIKLVYSQRRIREAKTDEDEFEALEDIRRNRLVKQDEMEALEDSLAHNKIPREEITQIMRIQSQLKIDEARIKAEWALDDSRTDHDWQREDLARRRNWGIEDESLERQWMKEEKEYDRMFNRMKKEDDYNFEKMVRARDMIWDDRLREEKLTAERQQREEQIEAQREIRQDQLEANREQRQIDKLRAMAEMQAQLDAQQHKHEEQMATISSSEQMNRDNLFANMTAEQIRAAQLAHLSEEAQVAMANAYNGEKEAELMRQQGKEKEDMMQQMLKMQQDSNAAQVQAMMQMAGMIKDTATGVSGAIQNAQQQQIDRLQNDNQHQQQRLDHTQDMAMENISKVSSAAAANPNAFGGQSSTVTPPPPPSSPTSAPQVAAPQQELIECQCYQCGHTIRVAVGTPSCPDCGAPFQW